MRAQCLILKSFEGQPFLNFYILFFYFIIRLTFVLLSLNNIADATFSAEIANLAIDRQRNRILTTKATKEAVKLADNGKV